jgi:hypothetical protein
VCSSDLRNASIVDGDSFSLQVTYTDGEETSASGYMKYPDNYQDFQKEITTFLKSLGE